MPKQIVEPKRGGRPTTEVKIQRDMAAVLKSQQELLTALVEQQKTQAAEMAKLSSAMQARPAPQARTVEVDFEDYAREKRSESAEPVAMFKCESRGLKQFVKSSRKINRGDSDYEIVPPWEVNFTQSTYISYDEEEAEAIRAKIRYKERKKQPMVIIEVKGEVFERLKNGRQVEAIKSKTVNDHTSPEELLGVGSVAS